MKITENISLAGYAFVIESDAYEELSNYLTAVHQCFQDNSSADEIVADIEERIAELLAERCRPGMTVNIKMIRDIESRIGNPDELSPEDNVVHEADREVNEETQVTSEAPVKKRLYREMDGRVLGGVCSGLGVYFNIDKAVIRIFFLIAFFIGIANGGLFCIALMAYIGLWIAMPAARSVEQKYAMRGETLDLNSYRSKDFNTREEIRDTAESPGWKLFKRVGGIFLGALLLVIGTSGLLSTAILPIVPSLFSKLPFDLCEIPFANIPSDTTLWILLISVNALIFIWMVYNGIMLSFDLKAPSWKPGLILFIAWLISILAFIVYFFWLFVDQFPTLTV